ncbi:hypothetical protein C6501_01435 [Candidatus Poribacteria bacterium]|nr:MAG: hypothetical protein C6501_01435 [Candidatus Poribacteria bacterium]
MSEVYGTQPLKVHIAVENFGPIEKAEIDLRPLTVFVGESNTGKTYLATLIYALFNTFEGFARVPLPHSIITLLKQSRFRSQKKQDEEFLETLNKLNTPGRTFRYSDFPKWLCTHIHHYLNESEIFANELKRCFDLDSLFNIIRFTNDNTNELTISLKVSEENQSLWCFEMQNSGSNIYVGGSINTDIVLKSGPEEMFKETMDLDDLGLLLRCSKYSESNLYFLPAAKGGILETHGIIFGSLVDRATRVGLGHSSETSALTGMTADFLKHLINYKEYEKSSSDLIESANLLEKGLLRGKIDVRRPDDVGYPQFHYSPLKSEKSLRMSQVSSMVLELTSLVLFLRGVVKPGDTLIIEEPEAHLHPRAQTKIAITLARLVRAGVRVIITTHSDWLLEQIGNVVREGEVMKLGKNQTEPTTWLTEEEVGAWWFHADKPVEEIKFDRIEGYNPPDYYDVASGLYNNAVEFQQQLQEEEN